MPLPVVPILPAPLVSRSSSRALSTSTWNGRISGHDSLTSSRERTSSPIASSRADLAEQVLRIDDDAVADVAGDALAHDPRRDQLQRRLDAVDDERVAGVVAALEAHDRLRVVGEPVDDLALALVAPLGADDDDVAAAPSLRCRSLLHSCVLMMVVWRTSAQR